MIKRLAPSSPFVVPVCTSTCTRLTANDRDRVTETERDVAPRRFLTYGNSSNA